MNKKFLKSLLTGLMLVGLIIGALAIIIGIWLGLAWSIGWAMDQLFDLVNFNSSQYIAFGSCILVFVLVTQIITLSVTTWFLVSWGKARVQQILPNKRT